MSLTDLDLGNGAFLFTGTKDQLRQILDNLKNHEAKSIRFYKSLSRPTSQGLSLFRELLFDLIMNKSNVMTQHGFYPNTSSVKLINFLRYPNPSPEEVRSFVDTFHPFDYVYVPDPITATEADPFGLISLLTFGLSGIYPSGRGRTSMRFFGNIQKMNLPNFAIDQIRSGEIVKINGEYAIPVTRYASGMSRGLYYSQYREEDIEFCGTFYYF